MFVLSELRADNDESATRNERGAAYLARAVKFEILKIVVLFSTVHPIFFIMAIFTRMLLQVLPVLIATALQSSVERAANRREFLSASVACFTSCAGFLSPSVRSASAETIGKDPDCNDSSCLGVWDGILADCPHGKGIGGGAGCTSSQDDTPGIFSEPWDYAEAPSNSLDYQVQMKLLLPAIDRVCSHRGDSYQILMQQGRYWRVLFVDGKSGEKSIGEFYFTPDDTTVQFRVGSIMASTAISFPFSTSLRNIERCEMIRKELRYLKVPVLRNRKRSFFFVESDLDTFGPGSAGLVSPADLKPQEIDGGTR